MGLELIVPASEALNIYTSFVERAGEHDGHGAPHAGEAAARPARLRPIGWHAYNIARIEAGTPVYLIDFGPDSLPAQSGVLHDRVNFKKGCYLGQEIVARMHSRGHSKSQLIAIRFEPEESSRDPETGLPPQPVTGAAVLLAAAEPMEIGTITSSTLAPMLSSSPIAFAHLK